MRQPKISRPVLFFLLLWMPWIASPEPGADEVYLLEDFEERGRWSLHGRGLKANDAHLDYARMEITPATRGRYYLEVLAHRESGIQILPRVPLRINGFVRQITLLVHGRGANDELFLDLIDRDNKRKREFLARLNHRGWKLLELRPGAHIRQRSPHLSGEPSGLTIVGFYFQPATPLPARLLLDDLSVRVRPYFLQPELRLD